MTSALPIQSWCTAMAKILLVEDDREFAAMMSECLSYDHHSVEVVHTGNEGLERIRLCKFDVIVLDWALPGIEGIEICRQFRTHGGMTPIIMITGKSAITDVEAGLNSGADDYLRKPFNVRELSVRVRAVLRRSSNNPTNILQVGNIQLDSTNHMVTKNGDEIMLPPREFALLEFFMRHPGETFSSDELLARVWRSESEATYEAIRTCIKRIRSKLDGDNGSIIETIPRVGYRLRR